jgi:hypothetical protein
MKYTKGNKIVQIAKEAKKIYNPSKMTWQEAIKKATKKIMK